LAESDLYLRTLRRASELIGDDEALARRLRVTPSHLALWIEGVESPPTYVFLRAVDVVSEHEAPKN
jgi:DNA-binding transcriptional regulator YdaS (Cro superfamily)